MGTTSGPIAPHDVADELPTAGAYAVLLILTGVYIIETTDRNMLGVSLIPFIDYSSYEYSLLSGTAFSLFYSIGGVFFSLCVDSGNVNLRTRIFVLTTGGFLVSLTFALTSVVTTFGQLFLLRIFMGLAQSVLTPLSMGILSSCFNGKYRGFAMGFYQIGGYVAFSMSLSVGTWVYDHHGWQAGYLLFGAVGMALSCLIPLVPYLLPAPKFLQSDKGRDEHVMAGGDLTTEAAPQTRRYHKLESVGGTASEHDSRRLVMAEKDRDGSHILKQSEYESDRGPVDKMHLPYCYYTCMDDSSSSHSSQPCLDSGDGRYNPIHDQNSTMGSTHSEASINGGPTEMQNTKGVEQGPPMHCKHYYCATRRLTATLTRVVEMWKKQPSVYVLLLAAGIRIGGGYVWLSYMALFYADVWVPDDDGGKHCEYSNAVVSEYLIDNNDSAYERNAVTSPSSLTSRISAGLFEYLGMDIKARHLLSTEGVCDTKYPYCVGSGYFGDHTQCAALNDAPWHNEGLAHEHLEFFMSWVPLVGSAMGTIVGGIIADRIVRSYGPKARAYVPALGTFISMPIICYSFLAGYPTCFIIMVFSGWFGENYYGQSIALLTDLTPSSVLVTSTAMFLFVTNVIGGNMPLLVPLLKNAMLHYTRNDDISVVAEPFLGYNDTVGGSLADGDGVTYRAPTEANALQWGLVLVQGLLYTTSGVLFMLCCHLVPSKAAYAVLQKEGRLGGATS